MSSKAAKPKKARVSAGKRVVVHKPITARLIAQSKRTPNRQFRLRRAVKNQRARVPGSFRLLWAALNILWGEKKVFGGIVLIYFGLSVLLVRGTGSVADLAELKLALSQFFEGGLGQVALGATLAGTLLSSVGKASSDVAGAYQSILLVIVSLALVWALRQKHAGKPVRIRDTFYQGMGQLVPFLLVMFMVGLQLLPLFLAGQLYAWLFAGGVAVSLVETLALGSFLALLVLWSLYMVTASVFALYVVTLPGLTPLRALRTARGLVRYRRWTVMRKLLFLPLALIVLAIILMLPIVLVATPLAEWVFYLLTMGGLAAVHAYMYGLYRELVG